MGGFLHPAQGAGSGSGSGCGGRETRPTRSLTPAAARPAFGSGSGSGPGPGPGSGSGSGSGSATATQTAAGGRVPRPYAPLWTKSNYSFLEGASHPEELIRQAVSFQLPAMALTDRDGLYGIVRALVAAEETPGTRLIYGAQVSVCSRLPLRELLDPAEARAATEARPVLLATSRHGYGQLCQLLSWGRRRCAKGAGLVSWGELCDRSDDLLLLHHDAPLPGQPTAAAAAALREVADAFGDRAYVLLARHRQSGELRAERRLRALGEQLGWRSVAGREVLYHQPDRRRLQDVLTCIHHGKTLHTAGRLLRPNAEHNLLSCKDFSELFADQPGWVEQTLEVAERCQFALRDLRYRYPASQVPAGLDERAWLRELTWQGAQERYPAGIPATVADQVHKELALIEQLEYGGYFLTMWELVQFCRSRNIFCQGRGSAANSAVCYCLGITAVDPTQIELLFERFLSLERAEPPDIDLDIEHERREEVIQYLYARFDALHPGAAQIHQHLLPHHRAVQQGTHAAMVANVNRYRPKSAVRDVGKALGLQETELDRMARLLSHYQEQVAAQLLTDAGLDPASPTNHLLVELSDALLEFPRHLSIHPGGFVLGQEPVDTLVPVENATMEARTVIQWDKDDVEALGLFKVDLLGLGMLAQIHRCVDLIALHGGPQLTMATIPKEDPAVYQMIARADTVGVFQIESRAQMAMLPRLKPERFYDLVVEVAIVRPGPISGGMVHPYLRRKQGLEAIHYPHPCLQPVLHKTLGVPLFQEQVMKLAMVAADYTPGEADQLRRDMAAWRRSGRMEQHRERLIGRMTAKGIDLAFAERIFEQLRGFGEYGFPESHAASFALIAYASAWLKCHHPAAFLCALLNAQPMGFYNPSTLLEDGRRHGIVVLPVCVQHSAWDCTLERGPDGALQLRMGIRYVKGVREEPDKWQQPRPPFASLHDFVDRQRLSQKCLDALAEADALAALGVDRRQALWQLRALQRRLRDQLHLEQYEDLPLFAPLQPHEAVLWDYRRTDHSPRGHPIQQLRPWLDAEGLPCAAQLAHLDDGSRVHFVGLVLSRQRPMTAKGVTFFTLEDESGFANLVVWKDVFAKFSVLARTAAVLGVTGRIQTQDGVTHIVVQQFWQVSGVEMGQQRARDFH